MYGLVLYVVVIPAMVYLLAPQVLAHFGRRGDKRILMAACGLFAMSALLPSPLIYGEQTQFMTHLLGGGVFCGLLWLYARPSHRLPWWQELACLFALTSGLGVLNELYELAAFVVGGYSTADTSWDLLANTLGVGLFYIVYRLYLFIQR